MKYHLITYGCQMNKSDSERIATILETKGHQPAETQGAADLIVINMCSVRQSAVNRVYSKISNLKTQISKLQLKTKNFRKPKIILTGCILDNDKKKFEELGVKIKEFKDLEKIEPKYETAFVPIMRGCNNFCAYCVVPYTRGREYYRDEKEIICEVKELIKRKYKEICLIGQNVNSYPDFPNLLRKIEKIKGDFKIRFLTNHPKDFSDELINLMAKSKKIIPYIHLPVQSGDDEILRKMKRGYTSQDYSNLIQKIKKRIPEVELTTDVIVGFPGETKKQFNNTLQLFKQINFKQAYIACYSPRAGTEAFYLKDNVPLEEKKKRQQILEKVIHS